MAAPSLEIRTEQHDGTVIVVLEGPVDSATYEQFREAMHEHCGVPGAKVLLDCSRLTYMNSKGFGTLSQYHRQLLSTMGRLAVCELNRKLVKTMDLLGLGETLIICKTREEALARMA